MAGVGTYHIAIATPPLFDNMGIPTEKTLESLQLPIQVVLLILLRDTRTFPVLTVPPPLDRIAHIDECSHDTDFRRV